MNEWEENMEMTGGTSLHLKDIILGIKENSACFVLAPAKEMGEVPFEFREIIENDLFPTGRRYSLRGAYPSADRVVLTELTGTKL